MLDGLRGIAAIGVMLYHAEIAFGSFGPFSRSYLFVDLFFLLSGFVLALSAEARIRSGEISPAAFFRGRVRRLWPTVAMGVLIGALFAALSGNWTNLPLLVALGLLMIPLLGGSGEIFPLNGPQWSILMELIVNLAHSLVLRRLGNGWLLAFVVTAGLALIATVTAYGSNTLGPRDGTWWLGLSRVAFSYGLGIWLAGRWSAGGHRSRASWEIALILPVVGVIVINAWPAAVASGDLVVVLVLWPAMLWLAATAEVPAAIGPWLDRLGQLSFPLYAVHLPLLQHFAKVGTSAVMMLTAIGSTIAAAAVLAMVLAPSRPSRRALVA